MKKNGLEGQRCSFPFQFVHTVLDIYLLELMKTAVFFILLKKALSHRPWVSGVSEQETMMKSLSDTSVSMGTVQQRVDGEHFRLERKQRN